MTCCHGISIIYGIKLSKADLIILLMNSTIEYKGKKDYDTNLKKIKEDYYKKSYNDMVKISLEDDCIPPTYEEYISDPFTIDFLDECIEFIIDDFKL